MCFITSEELMDWAVRLTKAKSIVGTRSERDSVLEAQSILAELDYFQQFPQHLKLIRTKADPLERISLMAMVESNPEVKKTLLLIGHTDTVEVDDYADLKDLACDPQRLMKALGKRPLKEEIRRDLESGDYLFGRGIFDMKSGTANHLALLANFSMIREQYPGRLVLLAVSDEEGESSGMLSCVEQLASLTKEKGWEIQGLINTDYTTLRYPNDPNRYIYTGTVGKVMPSFYIRAKEGHAGDPFSGMDANQLASYLLQDLDLNIDYCDCYEGETAAPMISLKQADLKDRYSVQLAHEAMLYFNYSTYSKSPDELMELMKKRANAVAGRVDAFLREQWLRFCQLNQLPPEQKADYRIEVVTYSELLEQVAEKENISKEKLLENLLAEVKGELQAGQLDNDSRALSFAMVRALERKEKARIPRIVCFFCPPFYPHNHNLKTDTAIHQAILRAIEALSDTSEKIVMKKFYPYISDLSFVSVPADERYESGLIREMPAYGQQFDSECRPYKLPFEAMRYLNLPVYDIGVYGKDAHQWSERVYKPYSFKTLPKLLLAIVKNLFVRE